MPALSPTYSSQGAPSQSMPTLIPSPSTFMAYSQPYSMAQPSNPSDSAPSSAIADRRRASIPRLFPLPAPFPSLGSPLPGPSSPYENYRFQPQPMGLQWSRIPLSARQTEADVEASFASCSSEPISTGVSMTGQRDEDRLSGHSNGPTSHSAPADFGGEQRQLPVASTSGTRIEDAVRSTSRAANRDHSPPPSQSSPPSPPVTTGTTGKTRKRRRKLTECPRDEALRKYPCEECGKRFARFVLVLSIIWRRDGDFSEELTQSLLL